MVAVAKESVQVTRARKKLERKFEEEKNQITPEAIKKVTGTIHQWIARHEPERISLKNKSIVTSTEAVKSKHILHLMQKIATVNVLNYKRPGSVKRRGTSSSLRVKLE